MGGAASQQQYIIRMQRAIIHSSLFLHSLSMYCMPADPLACLYPGAPIGRALRYRVRFAGISLSAKNRLFPQGAYRVRLHRRYQIGLAHRLFPHKASCIPFCRKRLAGYFMPPFQLWRRVYADPCTPATCVLFQENAILRDHARCNAWHSHSLSCQKL